MSYDLGHSRSYINNISSGKALPSMNEFFAICEYLNITPNEFFNVNAPDPSTTHKLWNRIQCLDSNDQLLLLNIAERLKKK